MNDSKAIVEHLLGEDCPVKTLSDLLSGMEVSAENISELENVIILLEMHEEEIRRLRQSISLHVRQYVLASYSEGLRKKRGKPE
jgi:hypothetical protein